MIDKLLEKLDACFRAREWAKGKSWEEIYGTCHRGDWLLWLFSETQDNIRLLTLAKGHCANTVRHLMRDERSIKAVDTAIAFGKGKASLEELRCAAADAEADFSFASFAASAKASASAFYAVEAASASASASAFYAVDASDAQKANQLQTANICRKYLPFEIWEIKDEKESEVKDD